MRLVKVANIREVLRRNWCTDDPILRNLPNLQMQNATNYLISPDQALRLDALGAEQVGDWIRNECVAGLWAYAETYGHPVSTLPGSPVSRIALLIGRAVSGVYAKVMNFRSIDPSGVGEGMPGAGETDRAVWREYYDPQSSKLRTDALRDEFTRLWDTAGPHSNPPDANATAAIVEDEAGRLEELTLEELLAKYAEQNTRKPHRPSRRISSARSYERNPLVIAIARRRASHRCEVPDCNHPAFETTEGLLYTEVHHIVPLAHGGEDTVENVACLCPAHHREVHLGARAGEAYCPVEGQASIGQSVVRQG